MKTTYYKSNYKYRRLYILYYVLQILTYIILVIKIIIDVQKQIPMYLYH